MVCMTQKGGGQMAEESQETVERPVKNMDDVDDYIFKTEQEFIASCCFKFVDFFTYEFKPVSVSIYFIP